MTERRLRAGLQSLCLHSLDQLPLLVGVMPFVPRVLGVPHHGQAGVVAQQSGLACVVCVTQAIAALFLSLSISPLCSSTCVFHAARRDDDRRKIRASTKGHLGTKKWSTRVPAESPGLLSSKRREERGSRGPKRRPKRERRRRPLNKKTRAASRAAGLSSDDGVLSAHSKPRP